MFNKTGESSSIWTIRNNKIEKSKSVSTCKKSHIHNPRKSNWPLSNFTIRITCILTICRKFIKFQLNLWTYKDSAKQPKSKQKINFNTYKTYKRMRYSSKREKTITEIVSNSTYKIKCNEIQSKNITKLQTNWQMMRIGVTAKSTTKDMKYNRCKRQKCPNTCTRLNWRNNTTTKCKLRDKTVWRTDSTHTWTSQVRP